MKIFRMNKDGKQVDSRAGLHPDAADALAAEWCKPLTPVVIVTTEVLKTVYEMEWHPVPGQKDGTVLVHHHAPG